MKINTKIRYGLRMLVSLAEDRRVINTIELGKRMRVSPKYLRKLAGPMEKHRLISSIQGINGGYVLGREPQEISLASILEAFDEEIRLTACLRDPDCELYDDCKARPVWTHIKDVLDSEFSSISLSDILEGKFNGKAGG